MLHPLTGEGTLFLLLILVRTAMRLHAEAGKSFLKLFEWLLFLGALCWGAPPTLYLGVAEMLSVPPCALVCFCCHCGYLAVRCTLHHAQLLLHSELSMRNASPDGRPDLVFNSLFQQPESQSHQMCIQHLLSAQPALSTFHV